MFNLFQNLKFPVSPQVTLRYKTAVESRDHGISLYERPTTARRVDENMKNRSGRYSCADWLTTDAAVVDELPNTAVSLISLIGSVSVSTSTEAH